MKPFTYHAPRSVEEALSLLEQHQASCAVVAGGTDVVIELNEGVKRPEHVIDISKISELRYVKEEDGLVKLGALDTFTSLERHPYVQEHLPALYETVIHVGSPPDPEPGHHRRQRGQRLRRWRLAHGLPHLRGRSGAQEHPRRADHDH